MSARTLTEKYERFDANCPDFYPSFVRSAKEVLDLGRGFFSAYAIVEHLRWDVKIGVLDLAMRFEDEEGDKTFKIPASVIPFYARRFMIENPRYHGFFELRLAPEADRYFGIQWKEIGTTSKGEIIRVVDWEATEKAVDEAHLGPDFGGDEGGLPMAAKDD